MKRIHYAWWVCAGCALLIYCTAGLGVNAFTIYQPFILRQNGLTNAQSSLLITIRSLAALFSSIAAEPIYRRLSLRAGMALAGLMSALGFAAYGLAGSYAAYCGAAVLIGVGFGIGTMTPISVVLGRWFVKDRMLAVSFCSAFTGLATFGVPSLLTELVQRMGLRAAFLLEAAVVALLTLISYALVRNDPVDVGMSPFGEGEAVQVRERAHGNVLLDRRDWLWVWPMALAAGAVTSVGYGHMTVYMNSLGYSPRVAAVAITVTGLSLVLSKLLYGAVAERIGNRRTNTAFGVTFVAGAALCCLIGRGHAALFVAMAVYGAGLSLTTVGLTTLAADWSVPDHYRTTLERLQTGYFAGALLFSPVPGIIADRTGGAYLPAYVLFLGCSVYLLTAMLVVYRRKLKGGSRDVPR